MGGGGGHPTKFSIGQPNLQAQTLPLTKKKKCKLVGQQVT